MSIFGSARYLPLAAAVVLSLSGCAGKDESGLPCPDTGIIQDAGRLVAFSPASSQDPAQLQVEAAFDNYRGACRYVDGKVEFLLEIDVAAKRGPAAGVDITQAALPYFVAILDPQENILQRQGFTSKVPFDATGVGMKTEKYVLRLPLEDTKTVRQYKVVMGFELTPAQLAYNRDVPVTAPARLAPQKAKKKNQ